MQKRRAREQLAVVIFLALALAATVALLAHQWLAPPASPAPASAGAAITHAAPGGNALILRLGRNAR
jgi:CHASE2 domain-containing sensor protein